MKNIDGYATVITNSTGKIVGVHDYFWNHDALTNNIGSTEIMDHLCDLDIKDSMVLIPLTYKAYAGDYWTDPEELLLYDDVFVMKTEYKQKYLDEIKAAYKDEHDWRYVDDMIKDYEEMYKEKVALE